MNILVGFFGIKIKSRNIKIKMILKKIKYNNVVNF